MLGMNAEVKLHRQQQLMEKILLLTRIGRVKEFGYNLVFGM